MFKVTRGWRFVTASLFLLPPTGVILKMQCSVILNLNNILGRVGCTEAK